MRKYFQLMTLFLLCGCFAPIQNTSFKGYDSFKAMAGENIYGRDYSIESYKRNSDVTVIAIHGGDIEKHTALVARKTADVIFNLYVFNGWGEDAKKFHITATDFDEPIAENIVSGAKFAVSFHAMRGKNNIVCIGGSNDKAGSIMRQKLEKAGFKAEFPCERLPGKAKNNIVNKPLYGGIQLEMTQDLLDGLAFNIKDLSKFTDTVRNAVLEYLLYIEKEKELLK